MKCNLLLSFNKIISSIILAVHFAGLVYSAADPTSLIPIGNDFVRIYDYKIYTQSYLKCLTKVHLYLNIKNPVPPFITALEGLAVLKVSFYMQPEDYIKFKELDVPDYALYSSEYDDNSSSENDQGSASISVQERVRELKLIQKNALKNVELLKNLKILEISRNDLMLIPDSVFLLTNISVLDVSSNKILKFQPEIVMLRNLETLIYKKNFIGFQSGFGLYFEGSLIDIMVKTEPLSENERIEFPKSLKHLDISSIKLSYVYDYIFDIESLVSLNLSKNMLEKFPSEVMRLKNLEIFKLSCNFIPKGLGQFCHEKIHTLDLSHCRISNLRDVSLPNLKTLIIENNQISNFISNFLRFPLLEALDVSFGNISYISPEINSLTSLKSLNVAGNKIRVLEKLMLPALETLNLGNCEISLQDLHNILQPLLKCLNLTNNNFSTLDKSICDLKSLETLVFISRFPFEIEKSFKSLESLKSLFITYFYKNEKHLDRIFGLRNLRQLSIAFAGGLEYFIPLEIAENKVLEELNIASSYLRRQVLEMTSNPFFSSYSFDELRPFNFYFYHILNDNTSLLKRIIKGNEIFPHKMMQLREENCSPPAYFRSDRHEDYNPQVLKFLKVSVRCSVLIKEKEEISYSRKEDILIKQPYVEFNGVSRAILAVEDRAKKINIEIPHLKIYGEGDSLGTFELLRFFPKTLVLNEIYQRIEMEYFQKWYKLNSITTAGLYELNHHFLKNLVSNTSLEDTNEIISWTNHSSKIFPRIFEYLKKIYENEQLYKAILIPEESYRNCRQKIGRIVNIMGENQYNNKIMKTFKNLELFVSERKDDSFCNDYLIVHTLYFYLESEGSFQIEDFFLSCLSVLKDYILRLCADLHGKAIDGTNHSSLMDDFEIRKTLCFKLSPNFISNKLSMLINATGDQDIKNNIFSFFMTLTGSDADERVLKEYFNLEERFGVRIVNGINSSAVDKILLAINVYQLKNEKLKFLLT